jgi:hypothetical protein
LGAAAGILAVVVYPRDSIPASSEGLAGAFFIMELVGVCTVVGAILGAVGAFPTDWRCRLGLGGGAVVGWVVGLGVFHVLPPALDRLRPPAAASDLQDHVQVTLALALICLIAGAVVGRIVGRRLAARAEAGRVAEAMNAWAEAELARRDAAVRTRD